MTAALDHEMNRMRRELALLKAALVRIAIAQDVPEWAREMAGLAAFGWGDSEDGRAQQREWFARNFMTGG